MRTARTAAMATGAAWIAAATAGEVVWTVDPDRVVNRIEPGIYGQFLEHIYHSCNGGLWGDVVWNRSFEETAGSGWRSDGDEVVQSGRGADQRLTFGEADWADYELSFEARKTGGNEGFLAMVRVRGPKEFYWLNLGGWGNRRHAFEKCAPSFDRQRPVGPGVDGGIDSDRWYRVRVRCEGGRLTAFLDDRRLIDYTDPSPIPSGAAGIGTWETPARFRNLRVVSIDGRVLFEGMPPMPPTVFEARHWASFGSGVVEARTGDALNADRFVAVRAADANEEVGLRQTNLFVRAGDALRGSMWLRGTAPDGVAVRLVADGRTLASASVPVRSADWAEGPLTLVPSADATNAALEIAAGRGAEFDLDQVSLMPDSAAAVGGFRPDLLAAVAALRPPVIRWPGGCYAEEYRWKDGVGPQARRRPLPGPMWDDLDVNSLGTDEFIDLCRRVGAEPLIVINTGRHDRKTPRAEYLKEALDWMEYCNGPATSRWGAVRAAHGHREPYGVRLWEIDNETWESGIDTYIEIVREFAPAMRRAEPSAVLIACGGSDADPGRFNRWDPRLIEACADLFDVLSIHHYEHPDRFADGPARDERWYGALRDLIGRSRNPGVKLFVSEWNAQSTDWRTGLYAGAILNAMERRGDVVTLAAPALFLRHVSARHWDNALVNFDAAGWFPAPNYVVMKLWRDHYAPERIVLNGPAEPLNAIATRGPDGRVVLKAVNPTAGPIAVEVRPATGAWVRAGCTLVAPGSLSARNTLASPGPVAPLPAEVRVAAGTARFEMPPYSAGVVILERR